MKKLITCIVILSCAIGLYSAQNRIRSSKAGILSSYHLEEGSGSIIRNSAINQVAIDTGTIIGATWVTTGKLGNCLSFDGTGDRVTCPKMSISSGAITVMCWINPSASMNHKAIISRETQADGNSWALLVSYNADNKIIWQTYNGLTWDIAETTALITTNNWQLVAGTWQSVWKGGDGKPRVYLIDKDTDECTVGGTARYELLNQTGVPVVIGDYYDFVYGFQGKIDEIVISSYAWTSGEIHRYYQGLASGGAR